jgi:hypothetical protein
MFWLLLSHHQGDICKGIYIFDYTVIFEGSIHASLCMQIVVAVNVILVTVFYLLLLKVYMDVILMPKSEY